jgi:hypothetical protein
MKPRAHVATPEGGKKVSGTFYDLSYWQKPLKSSVL